MNKSFWKKKAFRSEYLMIWAPLALITLAGFLVTWRYVAPAPPDRIYLAAGSEEGAYYACAQRYRKLLEPYGIRLEILTTAGSRENLKLLEEGRASMALIQGGTAGEAAPGTLQSLASLYFEPLWVFHSRKLEVRYLSDLRGKRIGIGRPGSGTRSLAVQLLARNGVTSSNSTLVAAGASQAAEELKKAALDAAFFVSSPDVSTIQDLLSTPEIKLLSFRRHIAYTRQYRFLSTVTLGEGSIDLVRDIPSGDIMLLAPAATLVARSDLHPALVPLMLDVATQVHETGGLFEEPNAFPSNRFTELPLNPQARRFLKSGPTFLYQVFPFWAASLMDRVKIMLLPLVTLLIPLVKIAPPVYRWRIRSKIYRWYKVLRRIDLKLEFGTLSAGLEEEIREVRELEKEVGDVSVPASYMEEFYNLRMHIGLMQQRLEQRAEAARRTL